GDRRPTLFPYTTLFRAGAARGEIPSGGDVGDEQPVPDTDDLHLAEHEIGVSEPVGLARLEQVRIARDGVPLADLHGVVGPDVDEDRKSTRLNSSHVKIS